MLRVGSTMASVGLVVMALSVAQAFSDLDAQTEIKSQGDLPDVLKGGPYRTILSNGSLAVPKGVWGDPLTLKLFMSSPVQTSGVWPSYSPLVLMFNGFQLPAAYYAAYRNAFSSWGYVALSYDVPDYIPGIPIMRIIPDAYEVELIPLLLDWVRQQSLDPASAIYKIVDLKRVAAFGHSRGAKLAALAFAYEIGRLQAAVLVDPVDMTSETEGHDGYPSAVDALLLNPKQALLIGAGVRGQCNPVDEGWGKFWPALSNSSWLHVLIPAGHMQFLDVSGPASWTMDRFCGFGSITHTKAINLTQGAAVAWLQQYFRPAQSEKLVADYLSWVVQPAQSTLIDWKVKQDEPTVATATARIVRRSRE